MNTFCKTCHCYDTIVQGEDNHCCGECGDTEGIIFLDDGDFVWEALHNPNIHESSPYTISLHRTKEGAEEAVEQSKKEVKREHDEHYADSDFEPMKWDTFHAWGVSIKQILD